MLVSCTREDTANQRDLLLKLNEERGRQRKMEQRIALRGAVISILIIEQNKNFVQCRVGV